MTQPSDGRGIRWGRTLAGGFLLELALMVLSVPFVAMDRADELPRYVLPLTAVASVLVGLWVGRRVTRPVLHGALAGLMAILIYLAIAVAGTLAAPDQVDFATALSPAYLASHALKVVGAAAGAWWVARRRP